ncbi:MAG: hypothetical protein ACLSE8_15580 [Parasutterella sp.]
MDKKETDYVMTKLVEFARINNVHIVVVAHCRSVETPAQKPTPYLIRLQRFNQGRSNITNIAFNVLSWLRDFSKVQRRLKEKMWMTPSLTLF